MSSESLGVFRIVYGILGFGHIFGYWIYYHLMKDAYDPDNFQFRYIGFEWVPSFHDPWMTVIMLSIAASAILVSLGWYYKWAAWYLAFGFSYVFLLEKAYYLNHAYLYIWIAFLMPLIPADRRYSMRVKLFPADRLTHIPYWPLFILRFLMGVVYFYGGLAKINPDWLRAVPLKQWMSGRGDQFLIGPILQQDWVPWVMAYGGLTLDLFAAFLLVNKRTRPWIFGFIIAFHIVNAMIFQIGIFPILSITLTALFFPADFPGRLWRWFKMKTGKSHEIAGYPSISAVSWQWYPKYAGLFAVGVGIFMAFHLLIPFRHHLIPGDVTYTEEGHRYSWRMMLRSKSGYGSFTVRDPESDWEERIDIRDHLWSRQRSKLFTHPDMIWQFAQYLEKKHQDVYPGVEVYTDITVRVNDHRRQQYIDPDIDLAAEEWKFFGHHTWIMEEESHGTK